MEFQTFCKEGTDSEIYEFYKNYGKKFYTDLGIKDNKLKFKDHDKLAHYAKEACDIQYEFPWGFDEINGTHNRTDYDLSRHEEYSGQTMKYLDPETNEKYTPYIIESTYGVDRSILAILFDAYYKDEEREVLKLHPFLAPYKVAVLPLIKKLHSEKATEVYEKLTKYFMVNYDEAGTIGKRYKRNDIIGTPFCITIDDETINNNTVTIRNRDTAEQITLNLDEVINYISEKIIF